MIQYIDATQEVDLQLGDCRDYVGKTLTVVKRSGAHPVRIWQCNRLQTVLVHTRESRSFLALASAWLQL